MSSNNRKIGAILSYASIIVSTLVQLIYTPFLIKKLGQGEYGLYSLVNSIIGYLTIFDLGFGNAIIVYTSKYRALGKVEEEKKMHGMFKIIFWIIAMFVCVLGIILYFNVNNIFGTSMTNQELNKTKIMMLILTFNLFITFVFNIYSAIINAYEKFIFQKIMSILNTLLKPILMIPLLFLGYKSITMVVVLTLVNLLVVISNYLYCNYKIGVKVHYCGFDKSVFKSIFGYSFWLFLGTIVDKINWSVDQFILGAISGTAAVAIYSVASQINSLFVNLSTAISGVMLPKITKMIAIGSSNDDINNEFIKVGRLQYYIIFLMVSGFCLVGKKFIVLWAGSEFVESFYVTLCLIIPVSIPLIQNLGLSIMQAKNKYKFKSIISFITAVFNVVLSIFLAKEYGPLGSAVGTAISLIICNVIIINLYYYFVIGLNICAFWKSILKMSIYFTIPLIIILLFMKFIQLDGLLAILTYAIFYSLIYVIICVFFVFNKYEKELFIKIMSKLSFMRCKKNG